MCVCAHVCMHVPPRKKANIQYNWLCHVPEGTAPLQVIMGRNVASTQPSLPLVPAPTSAPEALASNFTLVSKRTTGVT